MEVGGGGIVEVNLQTFSWRANETPRTTGVKTALNTLRTGDAYLRFYITTVQDG